MKKLLVLMFAIGLVIVSLLGAIKGAAPPDGYVVGVQMGTTVWGMRQAILEKPGTMLMTKDNLLLFMWVIEDGWAFASVNLSSRAPVHDFAKIAGGGNYVNARTMADLVSHLEGFGWRVATAAEVPVAVRIALTAQTSWLVSLAGNMPTFLVLPVGAMDSPVLEEYEGAPG
jgi:hypothetical protein